MKKFALLVLLAGLISLPDAHAGTRASKRIGIGVGLITEPFPSLLGYTLAYNFGDRLRLTGGYGTLSASGSNFNIDIKTYGLNLKYFLFGTNLSPFLEGGASSLSGSVTGTGSVSGVSVSGTGMGYFCGGGIDWQTSFGLNFGLSYKVLFGKNTDSVAAPGLHLGWFF